MILRCYSPNDKGYSNYGGRGITVCDKWRNDFWSFVEWCEQNGWSKNLHIDRLGNNGNYCPSNCKFSTQKENARNKRNNTVFYWRGKNRCLAEICEIEGKSYSRVLSRVSRGWSLRDAIKKDKIIGGSSKGRVVCIETGDKYESASVAATKLELDKSHISKVLKGKIKSTGGYTFKYL